MKSIGDQVKEYMAEHALNSTAMADQVTKTGLAKRKVNRQDIDNLTRGDVELPKYINALSKLMGVTVGQLTGAESPGAAGHWPYEHFSPEQYSRFLTPEERKENEALLWGKIMMAEKKNGTK